MLAALLAVAFFKAVLTAADISSGGKLLVCIYPTIEKVSIACSTDGSFLISIDAIQATTVGHGDLTCIQEKARNVATLSQCTYQLINSMFYYQFQYPRCNLKPSCIINGDLPSAIVILGNDNCTSGVSGRERDAVIISWSCVAVAEPGSIILTTTAQTTAAIASTIDLNPKPQSNGLDDKTKIGVIIGCVVFAVVVSATIALLLLARCGRLQGWTAAVKRHCCFRGAAGFAVHSSHATQLQPAVLVIDKRGNLSSEPQASISKREKKDTMKNSVQRKGARNEVDSSQPSDMEVEVDANDDYQKFSSDLLEICEEEPPAAEMADTVVGSEISVAREEQLAAKPLRRVESLHTPTAGIDSTVLAEAGIPTKAVVSANGVDVSKQERSDKRSRRKQYEMKWNARYQDTTETETDDRRPPPLPPPYVLDPDPQAYQLPWLPSPADSSDE